MTDPLALFEAHLRSFTSSGNPYDSLASVHLKLSDKNEALVNFKKALALDPTIVKAKKVVAGLHKIGEN